jgi:hypothetical protein
MRCDATFQHVFKHCAAHGITDAHAESLFENAVRRITRLQEKLESIRGRGAQS